MGLGCDGEPTREYKHSDDLSAQLESAVQIDPAVLDKALDAQIEILIVTYDGW